MFDAIITIPGEPVAQERHRDGKYGGKYDPSAGAKESLAVQAMAQWRPDEFPTDKEFEIDVSFYSGGRVKDGDNCYKCITDALEGFYWINDRQIKNHHVHVIDDSDNPRTILMIKVIEEIEN